MSFTRIATACSALMLGQGCFVIADLNAYEVDEGCDFEMELQEFQPHVEERMAFRIVEPGEEGQPSSLRALAVFETLGAPNLGFVLPNAVPPGRHDVDFFADRENNGYDDPPTDHTWTIEDVCADPPNVFPHLFDFSVLEDPTRLDRDLRIAFTGMGDGMGRAMEVRVGLSAEGPGGIEVERTVGLYRISAIRRSEFEVRLTGILDRDFLYVVSIWVDLNQNGTYDNPPTDVSWRFPVAGINAEQVQFNPDNRNDDVTRLSGNLVTFR